MAGSVPSVSPGSLQVDRVWAMTICPSGVGKQTRRGMRSVAGVEPGMVSRSLQPPAFLRTRVLSHVLHCEEAVPALPCPITARHARPTTKLLLTASLHVEGQMQHLEKHFIAPSPPYRLTCHQKVRMPTERCQTPFGSQQTKSETKNSTAEPRRVRLCQKDTGVKVP